LPCIIKPRSGQGSKNVAICRTKDQAAEAWSNAGELALAQELLTPSEQEITCAVFRSVTGEIRVLQLHRRLEGGMTSWARVIEDPRIFAQCEKLATQLEVTGSINVQLILTDKGPRIFEINPRFSSTVAMRDALGFRDFQWAVIEFLGNPLPDFSGCAVGSTVIRDAVPRVEPPILEEE
jgi:carbamoyl-phosphate synthase large subunit